jgi:hypothetical protein
VTYAAEEMSIHHHGAYKIASMPHLYAFPVSSEEEEAFQSLKDSQLKRIRSTSVGILTLTPMLEYPTIAS